MPRKAFNISILLFASVILLANQIVPHHYHEDTGLCFFLHCIDSKEAHKHDDNDLHEHQHEGNPFADRCAIDDDYYAFSENSKKFSDRLPAIKCNFEQAIFYHCFINSFAVRFRQKPCISLFYPEYLSRAIGLRAPPHNC